MEACLAGPCIHVMLNHAPIVLAEKAYSERLYVTEIDMSVFEPACCMMCRGRVAPKEVNDTMVTIKTEIGNAYSPRFDGALNVNIMMSWSEGSEGHPPFVEA